MNPFLPDYKQKYEAVLHQRSGTQKTRLADAD